MIIAKKHYFPRDNEPPSMSFLRPQLNALAEVDDLKARQDEKDYRAKIDNRRYGSRRAKRT